LQLRGSVILPALAGIHSLVTDELVKSNLRLAGIVLSPALPLNPGIVKVRTR
jgi:multicomponent Na+:H+ antiporter subunit E